MKIVTVLSCVLFSLISGGAIGATYYVDATSGNDIYAGTLSAPSGGNGPWRSLARVGAASLVPGDTVLLNCGSTWREPLVVSGSGTAASPIRIGSYPSVCPSGTKPLIDGAVAVPAANWELHGGRIYRTTLPVSLIANGTFDQGAINWGKWSPSGSSSITDGTDCAPAGSRCLTFASGPGMPNSILISPGFALEPTTYTLSFSIKAPSGVSLRVVVRRDESPWDTVGSDQRISGTGSWQTFSYSFKGTATVSGARLDIEVPANQTVSVDNVSLGAVVAGSLQQVLADEIQLEPAHHPNRGYNIAQPSSPYARAAADSDQVPVNGTIVSSFVTTGTDLSLPAGASLAPGIEVRIRTVAWLMDERRLAGVSGNRLTLDTPTTFALKAGWGYYLTGALWMLDSPGEWHYESSTNTVYIWMPDGNAPGSRVSLGSVPVGIDVANRSNVFIDGIAVQRVGTGVKMANASSVTIRNVQISDTQNEGIDASGSTSSTIQYNSIVRTGRDAIAGLSRVTWKMADGLQVLSNYVSESGVRYQNGNVVSLPRRTMAAIHSGTRSYVSGNQVLHSGYNGIWPRADSTVEHNYVQNSCVVLDDCGGIYLGHADNSIVRDNLIVQVPGAPDGKPDDHSYSQGQGIFIDDLTSGNLVTGNTVINADNGIHVHNGFNNRIENNRLYGNRNNQILFQEDSRSQRADGDIYGNTFTGNVLVPTAPNPSLVQATLYGSVSDFATFSGNVYSGLLSPRIARETWAGGDMIYSFPEWQAAKTQGGVPRNLDADGRQVTLSGFASYRMTGPSVIPNGNLANGATGWASWNQTAPLGVLAHQSCPAGPCLSYTVGGSPGIVSSAHFAVVKDQWYRVSFDLMTGTANQVVRWVVRRGWRSGTDNLYESLMGSEQEKIYGSTAWKRYSYVFKASQTINVNDPVTLDSGARLDFAGDISGQRFWISNAEMVPATTVGAELRTQIVFNPSMDPRLVDCPDTGANATFCPKYVRFTDGGPITWPYSLTGLGAEIIYSRGDTLADTDGDGIADIQDACPGSPAGQQVNSRGCAIGQ